MGGDVSVESEYGTGSCFTMRLPTDVEPLENPVVIKVESTISAE